MSSGSEQLERLGPTLGSITARLVARHDALDVLNAVVDACAAQLSVDGAGVLVADPRGGMAVIAASDDQVQVVELLQAHTRQGPCVDCITAAAPVQVTELRTETRWPTFTRAALDAGYRAVHALPMRLDHRAVGALNLLTTAPGPLPDASMSVGQAFADLAVLGLSQERDERRVERLTERTLTMLNDRVHLAQAVGMTAAALDIVPAAARTLLRSHSARTGTPLRRLAHDLTDGVLHPQALLPDPS